MLPPWALMVLVSPAAAMPKLVAKCSQSLIEIFGTFKDSSGTNFLQATNAHIIILPVLLGYKLRVTTASMSALRPAGPHLVSPHAKPMAATTYWPTRPISVAKSNPLKIQRAARWPRDRLSLKQKFEALFMRQAD